MTYRIRNIAVAVGLALIAALLTTFYVANYKRHVQQSESTVTVYVAKRDIPQGTPGGELLKAGWIQAGSTAKHSVVPGAILNPDQVRTLITREEIFVGEQVSLRRFADRAEQGVRAQLHGTLRAISIPGTPDALLAGTLRDGDHVDFLANLKTGDCASCFAVRHIARDVLVLHASTTGSTVTPGRASNQGSSVLLAVHDNREAQKIWFAVENSAGWSLTLRPVANASDSREDIEGIVSLLTDGASSANNAHYVGSAR
jgi:Flp pilus assembly protein CpaB